MNPHEFTVYFSAKCTNGPRPSPCFLECKNMTSHHGELACRVDAMVNRPWKEASS